MEINIKMNVAEIGTIISEVACSISASKNMEKNGLRMIDAAISFLEDMLKSNVDDEDMPFPENESKKDEPEFNWGAFKKGDCCIQCNDIFECVHFLEKCEKEGITWANGDNAKKLCGVRFESDEMPVYFEFNIINRGIVYGNKIGNMIHNHIIFEWGDINA